MNSLVSLKILPFLLPKKDGGKHRTQLIIIVACIKSKTLYRKARKFSGLEYTEQRSGNIFRRVFLKNFQKSAKM